MTDKKFNVLDNLSNKIGDAINAEFKAAYENNSEIEVSEMILAMANATSKILLAAAKDGKTADIVSEYCKTVMLASAVNNALLNTLRRMKEETKENEPAKSND